MPFAHPHIMSEASMTSCRLPCQVHTSRIMALCARARARARVCVCVSVCVCHLHTRNIMREARSEKCTRTHCQPCSAVLV